jgi:hypothetical protein
MGRHKIEGVWLKAPWEIYPQMREEVTERKKRHFITNRFIVFSLYQININSVIKFKEGSEGGM